ncbi:unnamed protein product [Durusdinium trenchii]|uniref:Uncharacterized protein n=1 Tax=Durusdinium trenchii TaxID=1381693 RepID=A0ABP0JPP3_9DINO
MLSWRSDSGCSGFVEPEIGCTCIELLRTEGFLSDPDVPGCKRLACTKIPETFMTEKYKELPSLPGTQFIPCFSVGYVKGWKRAVIAFNM